MYISGPNRDVLRVMLVFLTTPPDLTWTPTHSECALRNRLISDILNICLRSRIQGVARASVGLRT